MQQPLAVFPNIVTSQHEVLRILSHTCASIRLITGGHKNDMSP